MNPASRWWLMAAAGVAGVIITLVLLFGLTFPPSFASLYGEGGPVIAGTVAYSSVADARSVDILDLATGTTTEFQCRRDHCLQRWDEESGLLVVRDGEQGDEILVDPANGRYLAQTPAPRADGEFLVTEMTGNRAILRYEDGTTNKTLLDVKAPGNYGIWDAGLSGDGLWAWFVDSEHRLVAIAVNDSSERWLVAEDVSAAAWK